MSAVLDTRSQTHHGGYFGYHGPYRGIMRWITTTNHKDIGTMYLVFAGTMFFVGGIGALLICAELFDSGRRADGNRRADDLPAGRFRGRVAERGVPAPRHRPCPRGLQFLSWSQEGAARRRLGLVPKPLPAFV